ncbi:DUF3068 domain-containing protein [Streptomyces albulus]|nr:DUF3068 domain-containing protein [Streptomyces noursei]
MVPTAPTPTARTAAPLALVLLGAGVFLLVLAPLLAWYVTPRAAVTPVDVDVTTVFTGTGSYFDTGALATRDRQRITVTRHVLGDVAASERSGRAVWDVSTTVDTPATLPLADPRRSFQWTTGRWVTDRRSNAPVHCCGEGPTRFDGDAYLKFPFAVQKKTYRWWDDTLGAAVPLRFAGTVQLSGITGYRFAGTVPATGPAPAGARAAGRPARAGPDPGGGVVRQHRDRPGRRGRTGRIVDASISPVKTLRAPARGATRSSCCGPGARVHPATRRAQVALARADGAKLVLVGRTLPVTAGAAGGVLAVAGGLLVARGGLRGGRRNGR